VRHPRPQRQNRGSALPRMARSLKVGLTDLAQRHGRLSFLVRRLEGASHLARSAGHRLEGVAIDLRLGASSERIVRNEARLHSHYADHHYYEPVRGSHFHEVLSRVDLDPESSTFIDLGSGLGRPLLLAAELGFSRVIGVELDESLIRRAQRNLNRWSRRNLPRSNSDQKFSLLHQDAASVNYPDSPLVVFLANPFGEHTLRHVLEGLLESHELRPRPIWLCYVNPVYDLVFRDRPQFEERGRADMWVVYRVVGEHG
jgi:SAM-dependent methyltransferase